MPLRPAQLYRATKEAIEFLTEQAATKGAGRITNVEGARVFRGEVSNTQIMERLFPMPPAARMGSEVLSGTKTHDELLQQVMQKLGTADPEFAMGQVEMGFMFKNEFVTVEEATDLFNFVESLGPQVQIRKVMARPAVRTIPSGNPAYPDPVKPSAVAAHNERLAQIRAEREAREAAEAGKKVTKRKNGPKANKLGLGS